VPTRLGLKVPAQTDGNVEVTLSDTADDIATTGTVTVGAPTINLGATGGTVTVAYDPGTDGGSVTNCAHLTGSSSTVNIGGFDFPDVNGVDLEKCNTQTISAPPTCTPGALGCGWSDGDVITYLQAAWGGALPGSPAVTLLTGDYGTLYSSNGGVLEVGLPGMGGFSIFFTSATAVLNYLPATGTPGPLTSDLLNPTSSSSGSFGGDAVALQLNVDFSDAGLISGIHIGDLKVCGLGIPSIDGLSVRQVLGVIRTALGGGTTSVSIATLATIATSLNSAFLAGSPSTFAQDHLVNGACRWSDGDVISYSQGSWGTIPSPGNAAALLVAGFDTVYASSNGLFEVGVPGTAGYSMIWSDAVNVLDYLPAVGTSGPLTSDLINPTSSSAGVFGGRVTALHLNIDFSDAGVMLGTSGLRYGDLRLCSLSVASLNGLTVRQIAGIADTLLGGGSSSYALADIDALLLDLDSAFAGGLATTFAQNHLVNGTCP
jgi:hypothetical protein